MGDRLLTQNSVPIVAVAQDDGSTLPGIAISGSFLLESQRPTALSVDIETSISTDYTTGDAIDGILAFEGASFDANNLGITIDSLVISCGDAITPDLDLVFFSAEWTPSGDNNAFAPTDAEVRNFLGHIEVRAANWAVLGSNRVATVKDIGLNMVLTSEDVFAQLVARGTINFATADALRLTLGIRRD